jgi:carboxymethylenebutenolidase
MSSRTETVTTADGPFDLPVWLPEAGRGPGILLIQEIYAANAPVTAVVSFYGSEVPGNTGLLTQIDAPIQFHFGGSDPFIPRDQVAQAEQAVQASPNAEIHVEPDAGHAFHNRKAPMFHHPAAAARAWRRTEEFLARHLPVARAS